MFASYYKNRYNILELLSLVLKRIIKKGIEIDGKVSQNSKRAKSTTR